MPRRPLDSVKVTLSDTHSSLRRFCIACIVPLEHPLVCSPATRASSSKESSLTRLASATHSSRGLSFDEVGVTMCACNASAVGNLDGSSTKLVSRGGRPLHPWLAVVRRNLTKHLQDLQMRVISDGRGRRQSKVAYLPG